jgi:tetratricopeptide (TPR) repeat protein
MKNKNVAGLLALMLGFFGLHRFYLGQRLLGGLYFLIGLGSIFITAEEGAPLVLLPAVLALIDSVLFFAMPQPDFDEKYNADKAAPFPEAYYRPHSPWQRYRHLDQRADNFQALKKSGIRCFRAGRYEEAAEIFEQALFEAPNQAGMHYNLAVTYAVLGDEKRAFYYLERAVELGFDHYDKIHEHDALAKLRSSPQFQAFVDNGYRRPSPALPDAERTALPELPGSEQAAGEQPDPLAQILELGKLWDRGILTEEEFAKQKQRILERQ